VFRDRRDAGRRLAERLTGHAGEPDVLVLGLPRGGVPVAYEVAEHLNAPLDVFLVRKLGVPGHEELAMGAIASGGVRVLNMEVTRSLGIRPATIQAVETSEQRELARRERLYHGSRPAPEVRGRTVILVDDGLATGSSMWAAVEALRQREARRIVVAVPVAAPSTCEAFRQSGIEIVCGVTPEPFSAVGVWYQDFSATTDAEVRELLERADQRTRAPDATGHGASAGPDGGSGQGYRGADPADGAAERRGPGDPSVRGTAASEVR
jgi:predicted phosphoribosyltransferase